ncbi:MAG TPA: hypothetical protein EYH27_04035 [Anaerolineales bacterium]|nr:hypothetical protein [Anaerolineales bacterium]
MEQQMRERMDEPTGTGSLVRGLGRWKGGQGSVPLDRRAVTVWSAVRLFVRNSLAYLLPVAGAALLTVALLALLNTSWTVQASPPVEGNPLSFGGRTPLFTPSGDAAGLEVTDLDLDADLDLAFAAGSVVRVAAGMVFSTSVEIGLCGGAVNGLAAADLDRDTLPDLVAFCEGEVRLWRNPGNPFGGAWGTGGAVTASMALTFPAGTVADLDRDGAPDLVVAGSDGVVYLWRNPMGPGSPFTADWGSPTALSTDGGPIYAVATADLNQDGLLDLLATVSGDLRLWQNPGAPFAESWPLPQTWNGAGDDLLALAVADFDRDGLPDVAAGDAAGRILGWATPFAPGQPFGGPAPAYQVLGSLGGPAYGLAASDFDEDGLPDLAAVGGDASPSARAWRNLGGLDQAWDGVVLGGGAAPLWRAVACDLDGDGDPDLVAAGAAPEVAWWPNALIHGGALFAEPSIPVGSRVADVRALVSGDVDRDGWPDLVSGDSIGEIQIWTSDGQPMEARWTAHLVAETEPVLSLALADLDRDGDLEIVSGHTDPPFLRVWENQATGPEGPWTGYAVGDPGAPVGDIAVYDLDRDGWPDLVTGSGERLDGPSPAHKVTLWRNDGTPFDGPWPFADVAVLTYSVNAVAVGDLDGDGWADVVAGTDHAPAVGTPLSPVLRSEWPNVYELLALRSPTDPFTGAWTVTVVGRDPTTVTLGPEENPSHYHGYWGAAVHDVVLADLDRDGDLDIVSADHVGADYQVKVWENDGTPFDGQPATFHWTWQPTAVWYGTPPSPPWMGGSVESLVVEDFNRDGWPDVMPGITRWRRMWFENSGMPFGDFLTDTHWIDHVIALSQMVVRTVVAADFDRDGDIDVVEGSDYWDGVEVDLWRNVSGGVAEVATPTDPPPIQHGRMDDILAIPFTHNGLPGEEAVRPIWWRLRFTAPDGTPLTSAQANDVVDTLWIYRDGGNRRWSVVDTAVVTVADLTLDADGYQTITPDPGDARLVVDPGETVYFFVVVRAANGAMHATPNEFQVWFDADADSLVEGIVSGAGVAIGDAAPVGSGLVRAVGPPASVVVESQADGKGFEVDALEVASGYYADLYAVTRDEMGHFVQTEPVSWILVPVSGGVVQGDLVPGSDATWARLHGHLTGTAHVAITHTTLGTDTTGLIRVTPPPAQMVLEADPPAIVANGVSSATLRARLWDGQADPIADRVPVTFTVVSGGGSAHLPYTPYVALTAGGVATAPLLADTTAGETVVHAETGSISERVTVTLRPGPLAAFGIKGCPTVVYAGYHLYPFGPQVTAYDRFNNVKTDYQGSVYFLTSDPQATLSYTVDSPYTFTLADGGRRTFTGTAFMMGTAGMQTLTVTNGAIFAACEPFEVHPGTEGGRIELHLSSHDVGRGEVVTATVEAFDLYGNSIGDWTPWCKYTIDKEAGGMWNGNVYTTERFGTWTIVATTRSNPPRSDRTTLRVGLVGQVFLPLILRNGP